MINQIAARAAKRGASRSQLDCNQLAKIAVNIVLDRESFLTRRFVGQKLFKRRDATR
jgi:hypothetical protein